MTVIQECKAVEAADIRVDSHRTSHLAPRTSHLEEAEGLTTEVRMSGYGGYGSDGSDDSTTRDASDNLGRDSHSNILVQSLHTTITYNLLQ